VVEEGSCWKECVAKPPSFKVCDHKSVRANYSNHVTNLRETTRRTHVKNNKNNNNRIGRNAKKKRKKETNNKKQ
jgi:hypothetical protein